MKAETTMASIRDAERFIEAAKLALSTEFDKDKKYYRGGKNCATAKRASMDLSRSLANLRQGR